MDSMTDRVDDTTEKRPAIALAAVPVTEPAAMSPALKKTHPVSWLRGWIDALKHVWMIYVATHLVFLLLTYLASLFILNPYAHPPLIQTLLHFWDRWDTAHFIDIATAGYTRSVQTAFFPLYPFLIHLVNMVIGKPLVAALIVANLAGLGVLIVFYRLVAEDFGAERAERAVLYLAIFPTAFFLAAAYSESLFLFCSLCSFYCMKRGRWWLAGVAMFFATLTRSPGVVLVVPFGYEYLRQHAFQWRKFRIDVLACAGVGLALVLYSIYCYLRFHDVLAFSHAEATGWGRHLTWPGEALLRSIQVLMTTHVLSFVNTYNVVELGFVLAVLVLLVLSFVGPWRFARKDWMYPLYGAASFLLCLCVPVTIPASSPLDSLDRIFLVIFPLPLVLAVMGQNRNFHILYQTLGYSLVVFYLLLFMSPHLLV